MLLLSRFGSARVGVATPSNSLSGRLLEEKRDLTNFQGRRAVALVSGGLDSVVSLAQAATEMDIRLVIFFNYGQRALHRERNAVLGVVNYYDFPLKEVDVAWLGWLAPKAMRAVEYPPVDLASEPVLDTLQSVWIPNRNGVFLNIGAAYAESYGADYVITGFNREEAAEFPDNREEYVSRVNEGLALSTRNRVRVVSFTQDMDKPKIIEKGHELGAPLSTVWSCYHSRELMCGRCGSCKRLKNALAVVTDAVRPPLRFES
jgi:7-cyano-7-deazaguanine synthase